MALTALPNEFSLPVPSHTPGQEYDYKLVKNWYMFVCVACGLWGGLAIGIQTEVFTSNRYKGVQVGGTSVANRALAARVRLCSCHHLLTLFEALK